MKFEVGKCYMHTGSKSYLAVLGVLETTLYGKVMIAEQAGRNGHRFMPVGLDEDSTVGYVECSREEWMTNFSWGVEPLLERLRSACMENDEEEVLRFYENGIQYVVSRENGNYFLSRHNTRVGNAESREGITVSVMFAMRAAYGYGKAEKASEIRRALKIDR
jgi:hypothetical protein